MPDRFPVDEAQIVALFMESVAYGMYLVTLGLCVRALFWEPCGRSRQRCNWALVAVAALMCVFLTFDVAFGLRHNLDAFIFYKGAGGPDAEFEDISYWVNVMKTVDVQVMTLIGDGMLIYRCLEVFSRNWLVVLFPALLWLANAVCSAIIIYITATLRTDALLSIKELSPFLTAFLVLTLVTNVVTTGLIVWRIWRIDRESAKYRMQASASAPRRSRLWHAMRIVVESGLMYTTLVLITFGTEVPGSNAIYGVSDVMIVVIGISFNLIIIRVNQGVAVGGTQTSSSSTALRSVRLPLRSVLRPAPGAPAGGAEAAISADIFDRDAGAACVGSALDGKWLPVEA